MDRLFTSAFAIAIYMLAICVGSFYTTFTGFKLYLPDASIYIVSILSGDIQLLVYSSALSITNPRLRKKRIVASIVFLFALIASSSGSFLYFERSEERRVGKECTSWCRSRWSPYQ